MSGVLVTVRKPEISEKEFLEWVSSIPEPERAKLDPEILATFFVVKKILEGAR